MSVNGEIVNSVKNSPNSISRGGSPISLYTRSNTPSGHTQEQISHVLNDICSIRMKVDLLSNQVERNTTNLNRLGADMNLLYQRFDNHVEQMDARLRNHEMQIQQTLNQIPTLNQIECLFSRMLNEHRLQESNINQTRQNETNTDLNANTESNVVPTCSNFSDVPTTNVNQSNGLQPQISPTCNSSNIPPVLNNISEKSVFVPITVNDTVPSSSSLPTSATAPIIKPVAQTGTSTNLNSMPNNTRSHTEHTKPQTYDGSSSWTDYKVHFETVSKLNQWSEDVKSLKLIACMSGTALAVLGDIDTNKPPNYQELLDILTKRFAPSNQTEMYRAQIESRIRKKNETLPELAQDMKRLTRLAYPTATHEIRDILAYKAFRDALNDHDLEWAICQANVETIDAALHAALKYEAFYASKKKPALRHQKVDNTETPNYHKPRENKPTSKTCHYCNKPGHFARDCFKRQRDQQNFINEQKNQVPSLNHVNKWTPVGSQSDRKPGQGQGNELIQGN